MFGAAAMTVRYRRWPGRRSYFVKFEDFLFTSLNQGGSTGSEAVQSVTFSFAKITIGTDGVPNSGATVASWDLTTMTPTRR